MLGVERSRLDLRRGADQSVGRTPIEIRPIDSSDTAANVYSISIRSTLVTV